jgi:archaemetzincin
MKQVAYTVALAPIGEMPEELVAAVADTVEETFGLKTTRAHVLDDLAFAYDPQRKQYHSTPVLEQLAAGSPDSALKILGITSEDLFIPILTHVFGEAQLGGKACMISTHRLTQNSPASPTATLFDRVVKEAVHELGHTFDLRHCQDSICIMHYCRGVTDVDRKSSRFCRYCSVLIKDALQDAARVEI